MAFLGRRGIIYGFRRLELRLGEQRLERDDTWALALWRGVGGKETFIFVSGGR